MDEEEEKDLVDLLTQYKWAWVLSLRTQRVQEKVSMKMGYQGTNIQLLLEIDR